MAEYHVGNGFANIYAGTLSKDKTRWLNKSDVTDEAIAAVFSWMKDKAEEEYEKFGAEFGGYSITYGSSDYELVMRRKEVESEYDDEDE